MSADITTGTKIKHRELPWLGKVIALQYKSTSVYYLVQLEDKDKTQILLSRAEFEVVDTCHHR